MQILQGPDFAMSVPEAGSEPEFHPSVFREEWSIPLSGIQPRALRLASETIPIVVGEVVVRFERMSPRRCATRNSATSLPFGLA